MSPFRTFHYTLLCLLLLGLAILCAIWTGIFLFDGYILTAFVMFGTSFICFENFAQMRLVVSASANPRFDYGPEGTVIRPQKYLEILTTAAWVVGVASAAPYLAVTILEIDTGILSQFTLRVTTSISVFLLLFGGRSIYGVARHGGANYLRLTPDGFETWDGHWAVYGQDRWDEIEDILDHNPKRKRIHRGMVVFALPKDRYAMAITDTMTHESDALREWVRFYWKHPEHRGELVDERGLKRLEEQRFSIG